jgi:GT2 family glycosyltransferase
MSGNCAFPIWIVLLNWNTPVITGECIRSLQAMDSSNFKILVIDNGSTDGSVEFLEREFPNVSVLSLKSNSGFAAGCNIGIRYAVAHDADYVLLLNNDTTVAPDFLREALAAMQDDPSIAAVCPKIYFAKPQDMLWYAGASFSAWTAFTKHRGWKVLDRGQFDVAEEVTQATGCAMLVRCCVLSDVGLLDEQFWAYAEDLDWSLRFRKKGYRLVFAPKARVWHHCGATVKFMGSGSQEIRQFFSTRNMVFVARKHLHWYQMPSFIIGFATNHILYFALLRLWQHDFRAVLAVFSGLARGLRSRLDVRLADEPMFSRQVSVTKEAIGHADQ